MSIYDAAMMYQSEKVPLVVIAGQEYGTGSSRDWAAKGTSLLGDLTNFAKDPSSRFVKVTSSGIAKANFFVKRFVVDTVKLSTRKLSYTNVLRQSVPKYIYKNDTLRVACDTVVMNISFNYIGEKQLNAVEVWEKLPQEFTIVPNSAMFNGRPVRHRTENDSIVWRLGKGNATFTGNLQYKIFIPILPTNDERLFSKTIIKLLTSDSVLFVTDPVVSENIVKDTAKNVIATSLTLEKYFSTVSSANSTDTTIVGLRDIVTVNTSLFINHARKVSNVFIVDTTNSGLFIDPESISLNGIPIGKRYFTIKKISPELSSSFAAASNTVTGKQVMRIDVSDIVLSGKNTFTFSALSSNSLHDSIVRKSIALEVINSFGEVTTTISNPVYFKFTSGKIPLLPVIATYKDKLRPAQRVGAYYDRAVKIVDSVIVNKIPNVSSYITFDETTNQLTKQATNFLDDLILLLSTRPEVKFQINSFVGSTKKKNSKNIEVALVRSASIKEYLVANGVPVTSIYFRGYDISSESNKNSSEYNYLELIPR